MYFDSGDYDDAYFENGVGSGVAEIPFYADDLYTEKLGTFTQYGVNTPTDECLLQSAYSFDYDEVSGLYGSTLNLQHTCSSVYNTITGGSGKYGCATGTESLVGIDADTNVVSAVKLKICGCLCAAEYTPDAEIELEEFRLEEPTLQPSSLSSEVPSEVSSEIPTFGEE